MICRLLQFWICIPFSGWQLIGAHLAERSDPDLGFQQNIHKILTVKSNNLVRTRCVIPSLNFADILTEVFKTKRSIDLEFISEKYHKKAEY